MKLALDHHYSPKIAERLRQLHLDVVTVAERDWQAEEDESLLVLCFGESRALLTNNVADFDAIARRWQVDGRPHSGLVYTSDSSLPRTKDMIGVYVAVLEAFMTEHPREHGFEDRIHWLTRADDT